MKIGDTVHVVNDGPPVPSSDGVQRYATFVLVFKWDFSPVFAADGSFGVPFAGGESDLQEGWLFDGSRYAFIYGAEPINDEKTIPQWYTDWVEAASVRPADWFSRESLLVLETPMLGTITRTHQNTIGVIAKETSESDIHPYDDPKFIRLQEVLELCRTTPLNTPEREALDAEAARLVRETGYAEGVGMGDPDLEELTWSAAPTSLTNSPAPRSRYGTNEPMTEDEWLTSDDSAWMMDYLRGKTTDRKQRLYACGCCRLIWDLIEEGPPRLAVEASELYADRGVRRKDVNDASKRMVRNGNSWTAAMCAACSASRVPVVAHWVAALAREARKAPTAGLSGFAYNSDLSPEQSALLRHIFGNPFRPRPALPHVPAIVRDLAATVYQQQQAAIGPLHDALQDAGLIDLAEHFRDGGEWHPKGCWALDELMGTM